MAPEPLARDDRRIVYVMPGRLGRWWNRTSHWDRLFAVGVLTAVSILSALAGWIVIVAAWPRRF